MCNGFAGKLTSEVSAFPKFLMHKDDGGSGLQVAELRKHASIFTPCEEIAWHSNLGNPDRAATLAVAEQSPWLTECSRKRSLRMTPRRLRPLRTSSSQWQSMGASRPSS